MATELKIYPNEKTMIGYNAFTKTWATNGLIVVKHITLNHGAALLFTIKKLEKLLIKIYRIFKKFSQLQDIPLVLSNLRAN